MAQFDDSKHDFDLEIVLEALGQCHKEGDILDLSGYLFAYHELCRFFNLTGRLFGYVGKDLEGKVRIIETHQAADEGNHYQTIQDMLNYEYENGLSFEKKMGPKQIASGSRTLLRLHRALEFILEFMRRIEIGNDDDSMSHVAWEVYKETLANHHPWIVQKVAAIGVYLLPSRRHLIEAMCKQDPETVQELVGKVIQKGMPIYNITQRLYAEKDLLNIP